MLTVKEALKALSSFPTADALANYLLVKGVKGDRDRAASCPLANLLRSQTGAMVWVGETEVDWWADNGEGEYALIPLPPVLIEFTTKFDKGEYPNLESGK